MASFFLLVFNLVSAILAIDTQFCKAISCGIPTIKGGKCVDVNGNNITVKVCPKSNICADLDQFGNTNIGWSDTICVPRNNNPAVYCPGNYSLGNYEPCCKNKDCYSKKCHEDHCKGVLENETCRVQEDCISTCYCNITTYKCSKAKLANNTCENDYECQPGYGCNLGNCTQYWTKNIGTNVSHPQFCKTNWTNNENICDAFSIYIGKIKLKEPFNCTIGNTCTYKYDTTGKIYNTALCSCSGYANNSGYCQKLYPMQGIDNIMWPKIRYSTSKCSGANAHAYKSSILYYCKSISEDAKKYIDMMGKIWYYWALYSSGVIDDCAEKLELFDPNYNINSYNGDSKAELLIIIQGMLITFLGL